MKLKLHICIEALGDKNKECNVSKNLNSHLPLGLLLIALPLYGCHLSQLYLSVTVTVSVNAIVEKSYSQLTC